MKVWGCRPVAPTNGVASPKKVGPAHNFSLLVSIIKGHNILYIHGAQGRIQEFIGGGGGESSAIGSWGRSPNRRREDRVKGSERLRIEGEALCIWLYIDACAAAGFNHPTVTSQGVCCSSRMHKHFICPTWFYLLVGIVGFSSSSFIRLQTVIVKANTHWG